MKMVICSMISVILGIGLDFLIGDPGGKYHPICLIGNLIHGLDQKLRKESLPKKQLILRGMVLVLCVVLISFFVPAVILIFCYRVHLLLGLCVESVLCAFLLSTKTLKKESMDVKRVLLQDGLEAGRKQVGRIVGRDTARLTKEGVIKACVETVAENTSDGSVAPLFYMVLGGACLGTVYKAINTMDSMIGYKNDKYLYFGRAAAKLDDWANFIPARLSAVCMIAASFCCGLNGKNAWRIFKRDRFNHASPNSAQTESCIAGALQVQLAGDAWYFGKLYQKPVIGDADREIVAEDIDKSCRLMYVSVLLCAALLILGKGAVLLCMSMVVM